MLRTLALISLICVGGALEAQTDVAANDDLEARVRAAVSAAQIDGASLKERLLVLEEEFDLPNHIRDLGVESLKNERVRALLNLPTVEEQQAPAADGEERYSEGVFVLASFSMPQASLKALLFDASDLGVPVVFRGFVNNSVTDTEAAVRAIYTEEDSSQGFSIDPTLFKRFEVQSVPVVISLADIMDVCETPGCEGDPVPLHDRVTGNISLREALHVIANGSGDAPGPAQLVLEAEQ